MRRLLRLLMFALPLLALLLLALAVQTRPALPAPAALPSSASPWVAARQGWAQRGSGRSAWLREDDLNALLAQTLAGQPTRAAVHFERDAAQLQLSQPLPGPLWLNARLDFDLSAPRPGALPTLTGARIGHLPLPPGLAEQALHAALDARLGAVWRELPGLLEGWQARPGAVRLSWQRERARWSALAPGVGRSLPEAQRRALRAQHSRWALWSAAQPSPLPLPRALQALAADALLRTQAGEGDAGAELRALLLTLSLHAVGRSAAPLLDGPQPVAPPLALQLAGRDDMAQHFLLSAWLALEGGGGLSAALGLGKELADARGGSGFSFNDLAADEAGTRLGQEAARAPQRLLAALAAGPAEGALFPRIDDLPEYLGEAEFRRRFGGLQGEGYRVERARIKARIDALPLWRAQSS